MKVIYQALTILLVFQLYGVVEIGYWALFSGYLINFLIAGVLEAIVAGYEQARK